MLEIQNLKYEYEDFKAEFNFRLEPESFCLISGPSGAGKTTLMHLLCGFLAQRSGKIMLDGQDITNLKASKRPISLMFQTHNLFEHLNVRDNIAIALKPNLKIDAEQKAEIMQALDDVGLSHKYNAMPDELSGGEAQRVAIARAIIRKQKLLLLDEPLSSLDPPLRQEMARLIKDIGRKKKLTILMISHTPLEILAYIDKLIHIEAGKNSNLINIIDAKLPDNISANLKEFYKL